jgi:putative flippase GtrA
MSLGRHLSYHTRRLIDEFFEFGLIGLASTAAYLGLYELLAPSASALGANALALGLTAIGSTAANRHFTFRVRGRGRLGQEIQEVAVVLLIGLTASSGALMALGILAPGASSTAQMGAILAANALAAILRFLVLWAYLGRATGAGAQET